MKIENAKVIELFNSKYCDFKFQELLATIPDKFSLPDEVNDEIYISIIKLEIQNNSEVISACEEGDIYKVIRRVRKAIKVDLGIISIIVGVSKDIVKKLSEKEISILEVDALEIANILDCFSIPIGIFKNKLYQTLITDSMPLNTAYQSRLVGKQLAFTKKNKSLQRLKDIDKCVDMVNIRLIKKGREDLI